MTERLLKFKLVAESQNHVCEDQIQKMLTGLWDECRTACVEIVRADGACFVANGFCFFRQTKTAAGQGSPVGFLVSAHWD